MKTVYISRTDGMIGIARPHEPASFAVTDVPAWVEPREVLSTLAMYTPGLGPTQNVTYARLQRDVRDGIPAWEWERALRPW
jgi:hypothetical protein